MAITEDALRPPLRGTSRDPSATSLRKEAAGGGSQSREKEKLCQAGKSWEAVGPHIPLWWWWWSTEQEEKVAMENSRFLVLPPLSSALGLA